MQYIDTSNSDLFSEMKYEGNTLYATFKDSQKSYSYPNIPEQVLINLANANSVDGYFMAHIRHEYASTRIS